MECACKDTTCLLLRYSTPNRDLLDQVLRICSSFDLKLNPTKCDFFLTETVWCGNLRRPAPTHRVVGWFTTNRYIHIWVSDSDSHFKNAVIDKIGKAVGTHHEFTTAYYVSPTSLHPG
ncbi:hypothetical protein H257_18770 [Aphanomyces astaci]|uniref:Reverse transcriptase domain-containing protein n=1 Tax=Aphanomyces astaci TaxID=112090 RepID=W4FBX9_APHAT|nr:hypothetical protein H257_18770 [Aphanomyces astaci]ETV64321.1 hypothetical protein H257_18770 [Aphanomyces astaci]|eukprot:XP_009846194.1 hypothetical protein H257_18770 [Aphanomyces astaci]